MKKIFLGTIFILLIGMTLTSCGTALNGYSTMTSIDPQNYTTYVNKEIDLVMNILNAHIAMATNITKGKYPIEDELINLEYDIKMVEDAISSVKMLNPPNKYETARTEILQKMTNALETLKTYDTVLTNNETNKLQDCVSLMEGEYTSLSASFNLIWE